jgi:hypothetical protein
VASPSDEEMKKVATNENSNNPANPDASGGHAMLYICKIPKECISNEESRGTEDIDAGAAWDELICRTCQRELQNDNREDKNGMLYMKLSLEKSRLLASGSNIKTLKVTTRKGTTDSETCF